MDYSGRIYYRLNVVPIGVPPLRDRAEDIPDLISHIMEKSLKDGLEIKTISVPAMDMMKRYDWPYIRELENLVRRLLVLMIRSLKPIICFRWLFLSKR